MQLVIELPPRQQQLAFNRRRWTDVLADRGLADLPYRIETNVHGQIIMTPPPSGAHSTRQGRITVLLDRLLGGNALPECPISTIDGVKEDVTDIILNLKQLLVRIDTPEPQKIRIDVERKGEIRASDIVAPADVKVVNPDLLIATLTEDGAFRAEMEVKKGRGYVTAEENAQGEQEIGLIPVDSIFSPIRRVKYSTENTRVGQMTNYDRLILEIWTDGTVSPEMAIVEGSKILRKHLNPFVQYFELGKELEQEKAQEEETALLDQEKDDLRARLNAPVGELELSVRAANCLEAENIKTVRDLVVRPESDMLKFRNFGKTSLTEIKEKLSDRSLELGMDLTFLEN